MSHNSENGLLAMIERLWRAFMAVFWVAVMVLLPILGIRGLYVACRRRRIAEDKYERRYWCNEIVFNACLLYGILVIYYHLFQDIIFYPFGLQAQEHFTAVFDTIMGLPTVLWYVYTGRSYAPSDDPLTYLTATFFGVFALFLCSFALSYFRVFGHESEDGTWVASEKRCRELNEQFDREEAPSRALSKQWYQLQIQHPRNHPAWSELPVEQQQKLTVKWETEKAELWKKMDECPRASYFNRSK
ncbi:MULTISPECIES: hypothetical protein [Paraburkholderia]|uniref:hypothetical protein n=1 Tax=Paraburkholderia TaxID=1822464 RepID=UPI001FD2752C|nr:hypothetical protein [Paraburkholderia terricola]